MELTYTNNHEKIEKQIKDLKDLVSKKEKELNFLKLKEYASYHISFNFDINLFKKLKVIKEFEKLFNIKLEIKKHLSFIDRAYYYNLEYNDFTFDIIIDKYGIRLMFFGALENKSLKDILTKIMLIIKEINNNEYLGVVGIRDILVPEIENGGFRIIKL